MGSQTRKSTFNIVRQVRLDEEALKKIAEALGIPAAEHDRIISISGEIHIGPPPASPGGSSPPTSSGGGSPPTSPGGGSPPTSRGGSGAPATMSRHTREQE
jgi:hypothetical protein